VLAWVGPAAALPCLDCCCSVLALGVHHTLRHMSCGSWLEQLCQVNPAASIVRSSVNTLSCF
jgi:hypothetical protein